MKNLKTLAIIICICLIANCSGRTKHFGYTPQPNEIDEIMNAKTQQDVYKVLGPPSVETKINNDDGPLWIYTSNKSREVAFFPVKYEQYDVITVFFDKDKKVKNIEIKDLKDKKFASLSGKETKIDGLREISFWESVFGNVGSITPSLLPNEEQTASTYFNE